jgi:cyclic dehypoxanthinyl futalosine synthase
MRIAHKLGLRTSVTMMFGHIESYNHRIEHLEKIRRLQDETGGFTAFIPWTFQPQNTAIEIKPTGSHDYLRTLAISRIYLDNIDNIQASWVTQGDKIGQLALFFGANDMGSTMLEENVVKAAGVSFSMTESRIRSIIEDAGFIPIKRDTYYNELQ